MERCSNCGKEGDDVICCDGPRGGRYCDSCCGCSCHGGKKPKTEKLAKRSVDDGVTLSASRVDVEHNIAPPLSAAVTLPVRFDGKDWGVVVYVTTSRFIACPSDKVLQEVARLIARRVNGEL